MLRKDKQKHLDYVVSWNLQVPLGMCTNSMEQYDRSLGNSNPVYTASSQLLVK